MSRLLRMRAGALGIVPWAAACGVCVGTRAGGAPAGNGAPTIQWVAADRTRVAQYERVSLEVGLRADYDNPFDSREIRLDAEVFPERGTPWGAPGFLYAPFRREVSPTRPSGGLTEEEQAIRRIPEGGETLIPEGPPVWRVRLAFAEAGTYRVRIRAADGRNAEAVSEEIEIRVAEADVPGFVRVSRDDARYFVTDRGESFFPVGANVCWSVSRQTLDYDDWMEKYAAQGANLIRVWLSPDWVTLAMNTRQSGHDRIDLERAWRLDHVLDRARALGMRVMLCIESHALLGARFPETPWHRDHGGPLDRPEAFFTDPEARRAFRDKLRYLVARYGSHDAVFAWEFWNEVDAVTPYDSGRVTAWHAEMARHLRSIDPWRRPITTSTCKPEGDPRLDALPEMEIVQTHRYEAPDMVDALGRDREDKDAARSRPHLHGEIGISHSGPGTREIDPRGIHLHNSLYASVGQQQAGGPLSWWWDSYIHPLDLYPILGAFRRWIEGFDFVAQRPAPVRSRLIPRPSGPPEPFLAVFPVVRGTWRDAPFNRPIRVTAGPEGWTQSAPLSTLLHGTRNHPHLHNPVTFELDVPVDTVFAVEVQSVSGWGGGRLRFHLDGELVREEDFPVPGGTESPGALAEYRGDYRIALPAGRRTVRVENTGRDWIQVLGYRIDEFHPVGSTDLRVLGLNGRDRILVWFQNPRYTWSNLCLRKRIPPACPPTRVVIEDVVPGTWRLEWWDPAAGTPACGGDRRVGEDGILILDVPPVAWDAAVRLFRTGPAEPERRRGWRLFRRRTRGRAAGAATPDRRRETR